MLAVAMDFGEHRKEGLGVGIRFIKISARKGKEILSVNMYMVTKIIHYQNCRLLEYINQNYL